MGRPFSARLRGEILKDCASKPLDVAIIGGGITGAGVFRDAALRGMRAALFERDDFASGTSSRSSKLIHGGLRYLETYDFRLVFEACRERKILLKTAPALVRPLPFLVPVHCGQRRGLPMIAAGVWLYDLLSLFHNVGHPRIYGARSTLSREPALQNEGLTGSALYWDAVTNDAQLTLATIQDGWDAGGMAVNHAEIDGFTRNGTDIRGVRIKDKLSGENVEVQARWVVNTTGPWSDLFRQEMKTSTQPLLRLTKGTHLTFEASRFAVRQAILMLSPSDGRVTFVIPWEGFTLVGTTDTDFDGNPSNVQATREDVDYLLDTANFYFPALKLKRTDIVSTWAGLRPLLRSDDQNPSNVSREHKILFDPPGLVTMAGGKLTTYRKMAEELLDRMIAETPEWANRWGRCETSRRTLPDRRPVGYHLGLEPTPEIVRHFIEESMAATVSDVLYHRCGLPLFHRGRGLSLVKNVADVLNSALPSSAEANQKQQTEYESLIRAASAGLGE